MRPRGSIAVALHDIEPATFERCALLRDWLEDRGVDRATLLVIPARDLHPLGERSPGMIEWLAERRRRGDSLAQHGFQHAQLGRRTRRARMLTPTTSRRRGAEFVGLDPTETRQAVDAGWRVLKLAGVEPDGFVAPGYAYTRALRSMLTSGVGAGRTFGESRFRWWAGLLRLHRTLADPDDAPRQLLAPAWDIGSEGVARRLLSPSLIRAGSLLGNRTLRLDLYPTDIERPRHMLALQRSLEQAQGTRTAITFDELAAGLIDEPRTTSRPAPQTTVELPRVIPAEHGRPERVHTAACGVAQVLKAE